MSTQITDRPPPIRPREPRWPLVVSIVSVIVLVAAVVAGTMLVRSGDNAPIVLPTATSTAPVQPSTPPTAQPSTPPSSSPAPTAPTSTVPTAPPATFGYQPLWPFGNLTQVAAWQRAYRQNGSQPWHLDAAQTALSFTRDFLGYTEIDQVTSRRTAARQAWIGVGYRNPAGQPATAATLHLARMGTGADAPWEVVGTRDTTLTLTTPPYGATRSSPMRVGGQLTGVDESLTIQVHALGWPLLGEVTGIPAGGQNTPWSARVYFTAPRGTVLTIAVSTGGHVQGVERFAITGIVAGRALGFPLPHD